MLFEILLLFLKYKPVIDIFLYSLIPNITKYNSVENENVCTDYENYICEIIDKIYKNK